MPEQLSPVVNGPDFVALQVSDFEVSRRFWVDHVGLTPAPNAPPGAVVFRTKSIPFAITTPKVDLNASTKLGWGVALWIHTENADALCAQLKEHGARIIAAPSDGAFGRQFTFLDPDGYAIVAHDGTEARPAVSTIAVDAPVATLINMFEVDADRQAELITILEHATVDVMRHLPGFVSANIHCSLDGTRVANYAQWRSVEDFERMLANPEAQVHMRQAGAVAKASPALYRVTSVHR